MNPIRTFWGWLQRAGTPPNDPMHGFTPTTPAGEAREPISDQDGERQRALVARRREVMDLACLHANAYVLRDYGAGAVVEVDRPLQPINEGVQLEIDHALRD